MTDAAAAHESPRERGLEPTGLPALDQVLGGGVPRGALVLVLGAPGSGKTTLAGQIAFATARAGQPVLLLAALSEATSKLVTHLRGFTFFEESLLGNRIQVLSLQAALGQGQEATKNAVVDMVRRQRPRLVVLDGFQAVRGSLGDLQHARQFMYELSTTLHTLGVTLLVTSEINPRDPTFFPESTTVDVIVGLHFRVVGVRQYRGLEIIKARETAPLAGIHTLLLGREGVHIAPQLEERVALETWQRQGDRATASAASSPEIPPTEDRASLGIAEVDQLLSGGLPRSTNTLLLGTPGVGKTLLSLHFLLDGIKQGEPALLLSFQETQAQLLRLTAPFILGPQVQAALQPGGGLTLLHVPALKLQVDVVAEQLFAGLEQTRARRLVIDGIAALEQALQRAGETERLEEWLTALLIALQQRGVTALLTRETIRFLGPTADFPADPLTILAENVLLCQQVSFEGQLHRVLAPLKMRYAAFDPAGRAFRIVAPTGLEVLSLDEGTLRLLASMRDPAWAFAWSGQRPPAPRSTAQEES
ncbi:MAG TPA: ATPase domain-containing protein [Ktedonobacterales bacterium]|nr:ATPase domain-containing protein [Ktedonobacterales bacterium]